MDLLLNFQKQQIANVERPRLQPGDIVRVETKILEGDKVRIQGFEGTVLGIRGTGPSTSFTVRRETGRFGVERIFQLYSPLITAIEVTKRQKVRRAKLFYLRKEGRRRVKEDELSMQRLVKEEGDKKRLAAEAKKRKEEAEEKAAKEAVVVAETKAE